LFVIRLLFILTISATAKAEEHDTTETKVETVDQAIARMSLEQKVGQLFVLGYAGSDWTPRLYRTLKSFKPGALIAFGRNVKSLYSISEINRNAQVWSMDTLGIPIFTMVDQEGGSVARIKTQPPTPSALALGQLGDESLTRSVGLVTGEILFSLGFNFNLAPVLDLSDPRQKNFIGNRSFGNQPDNVAAQVGSYIAGLAQANVIGTGKHFPGHGGITQDSHKKTPVKLSTLDELMQSDLIPFKRFSKLEVPAALMVAHVAFPNIDPSNVPASFSHILITDVLRRQIGFNGLVITDDIEMLGAESVGSIEERAIHAIEAGCDMVMVAWSPKRQARALRGVLRAVKSGRISQERLTQSLRRIVEYKLRLKSKVSLDPLPPDELRLALTSKFDNLREITRKINRANFSKSLDQYFALAGSIPPEKEILVFSADRFFYNSLAETITNPLKLIPLNVRSLKGVASAMARHSDSLGVYYVTGQVTARALDALDSSVKSRLIVVNATYPGSVSTSSKYWAVIEPSSLDPTLGRWLGEGFFKGLLREPEIRKPSNTPEARRLRHRRRAGS